MVLSADVFFGNRGTLVLAGDPAIGGSTTPTVLKNIEINDKYEHTKLFGFGSINRQGVARHNHEVEVKIKFAKFDATTTTFIGTLLQNSDSITPLLWTVTATAVGDTTTNKLQAEVTHVYFENFPMNLAENDYMVVDLTGYGDAVTYSNPA